MNWRYAEDERRPQNRTNRLCNRSNKIAATFRACSQNPQISSFSKYHFTPRFPRLNSGPSAANTSAKNNVPNHRSPPRFLPFRTLLREVAVTDSATLQREAQAGVDLNSKDQGSISKSNIENTKCNSVLELQRQNCQYPSRRGK